MRELQAMQNKDKICAPEEFTLPGAFFCPLFYSATARHEQDTKCLRMASRSKRLSRPRWSEAESRGRVVSPRKDIPFGVYFVTLQ